MEEREIDNVVQASAEGYSFPSNLDVDSPSPDDVAPRSQAGFLYIALKEQWSLEKLEHELVELEKRRQA